MRTKTPETVETRGNSWPLLAGAERTFAQGIEH
jgi:hypothetical protein